MPDVSGFWRSGLQQIRSSIRCVCNLQSLKYDEDYRANFLELIWTAPLLELDMADWNLVL